MFYIHGCSWQAGVCVCVYVALLWSRATWVCQHPARRSPRTRGCGGAGSCWHGRPVQRDGAGDVGREQNRAAFVLPSAEPGKTREPPVSACTSRQGGKWTYRCCTVLLRLWSVMCLVGRGVGGLNNVPYIPMTAKWRWMAECSVEKISPPSLQRTKQTGKNSRLWLQRAAWPLHMLVFFSATAWAKLK